MLANPSFGLFWRTWVFIASVDVFFFYLLLMNSGWDIEIVDLREVFGARARYVRVC